MVDAQRAARELNNPRVINTVMVGVLAALLHFPNSQWEEIIRERVPARFVELNLRAFGMGLQQVTVS
jgi:indolepyruvate ferredoxin oxidoreductase beta subunit